jgi:magnesium chelatase family protein
MSLARVFSRAGVGVTAPQVTVEVHLGGGLPRMSMVGYIKPKTKIYDLRLKIRL